MISPSKRMFFSPIRRTTYHVWHCSSTAWPNKRTSWNKSTYPGTIRSWRYSKRISEGKEKPRVTDWQEFCRNAEGVTIDRDGIEVVTPNERHHRVRIRETPDTYELTAVVSRPAALRDVPDAPLRAWRRNR